VSDKQLKVDLAIFGGGVAGLWLLASLRAQGYNAVLFENQALGAGQTGYAQGIIHGGTKYALTGKLSNSAQAVADMPRLWRACLQGEGPLDLRAVKIMAPHQFMWTTTGVSSRVAGFFASRAMRSRTEEVKGDQRPQVLQHPRFKGRVYRLNEPVIDTASLIRALAELHFEAIFALRQVKEAEAHCWRVELTDGTTVAMHTKAAVLAAGQGNAQLLAALGRDEPTMQRRSLHMVMVRGGLPEMLYGHCLGPSALPRLTITSHRDAHDNIVWYLGGQLAEEGVPRSAKEQIQAARGELQTLLPWLDLAQSQWATLRIDRAEPKQADGRRPDNAFASMSGDVITVWPTKMALAPTLVGNVASLLARHGVEPGNGPSLSLPQWPHPPFAPLPWQEESKWNIEH
jgi:glycine/D-amino acid oxidase-like deaminating enzyme